MKPLRAILENDYGLTIGKLGVKPKHVLKGIARAHNIDPANKDKYTLLKAIEQARKEGRGISRKMPTK